VATAKARSNIRHYLKNLQREEALVLGRRMLNKALLDAGTQLDDICGSTLDALIRNYGARDFDQILVDLGLGKRLAALVARQLIPAGRPGHEGLGGPTTRLPLAIKGTEGMVVTFAKCCRPLPGDLISGLLTAGKGIVVHRSSCRNVRDKDWDRLLSVVWSEELDREFLAEIRLDADNKRGVLATVASRIAGSDSNISNVTLDEREGTVTTMTFVLSVRDRTHLARVMRRLRNTSQVLRIARIG
jgi:(p)ppGpp synthase/HD superfamily hydrolase